MAVAVTSPELVLAVEVCKDPGQKDSVLIHKVGEHVKKCQEMSRNVKNMRLAFLIFLHGGKHIAKYLSRLYFCQCALKSLTRSHSLLGGKLEQFGV